MRLPVAPLNRRAERGVYIAPWTGPESEFILLAITSRHLLIHVCPVTVPRGADHIAAAEQLWDLLDEVDPLVVRPALRVV